MSTLLKKHSFDTVFDSQKVFRLLLEAMSNPLRTVSIKEYACKMDSGDPAFLALAMTLLDNEVSFNTCGNSSLANEISSLTLAKSVGLDSADFVFVNDPDDIKTVIESVKYGTLTDPHKSATVVIQNDEEPDCLLGFYGPGIDRSKAVLVTPLVRDAVLLRDAQGCGYPQGIDLIFLSRTGGFLAIPRLVKIEMLDGGRMQN